jgi:glucose/arabinose dehydrogenase/PKD repeat protein
MAIVLALIIPLLTAFSFPLRSQAAPEGPQVTRLFQAAPTAYRVLVFSKTAGFRHDAIGVGTQAIRDLGSANGFTVDASEDATIFSDAGLAPYSAVVWLLTTGDALDDNQQAAFERFIRAGKGYIGVHSASDTEYTWPWYGDLVGAWFASHPAIQTANVEVADHDHPSTAHLADTWRREDEWYNYRTNPRATTHVLATLDEGSYTGGSMGADHPLVWCQRFDGGRSWYTGMGHTQASYADPAFRQHLLGGIEWAAGAKQGNCDASDPASFEKIVLDQNVNDSLIEPMDLDILPDGRVIYVTRRGVVKIWRPTSNNAVVAATVPVSTQFEDGLSGIAQDPNFASNGWVYLYYMASDAQMARVSRFTLSGDTLALSTEVKIIEWPVLRGNGHTGGGMAFDENGNLFVATGDNNGATGYVQPASLNTSANTNDLRGKILRIKPGAAGGYTVPAGNMYAPGTAKTRAEVYAMGFRNPYRIAYDAERKRLYVGDVGPDAGTDGAEGPRGYDEFIIVDGPGFHGWPMCVADNKNYTGYNCAAPVNSSPGNTGLQNLPAAKPAWIWYHGGEAAPFPEMGSGSRTALAGAVYHYNPNNPSTRKLPSYYDDTVFLLEFSRNWIREAKLDSAGGLLKINPVAQNISLNAPIAMDIGPDGAIYLLEYAGWFNGSSNTRLSRINYKGSQSGQSPLAEASSTPDSGKAPLVVQFSSAGSVDPDGGALTYAWDFDGNGTTDSTAANPSYTYTALGTYNARLTVTDPASLTASVTVPIVVGNSRPVVNITIPPDGGFFEWGGSLPYQITVSDAEDGSTAAGTIDCSRVVLQAAVGHDVHAHPLQQVSGCSGTFAIPVSVHSDTENVFLILSASYVDKGSPALTGSKNLTLQPKRKQAEHFSNQNGVQVLPAIDQAGGLSEVVGIDPGDWLEFTPINFQNMTGVRYRVASQAGGTIELRLDSPTGTLLSSLTLPANQGHADVSAPLAASSGTHKIYIVFKGSGANLFRLNWIDFSGAGVSGSGPPPTATPTFTPCNMVYNVAAGKPSSASSGTPGPAFDGNTASRWESAWSDPQWIQVDLGSVQSICRVVLNWEGAYASTYQIQASVDGATWSTLKSVTGGDGGIDDHTGLAGSGRYLRMYGTARGTGYGYSLWEFEAYTGSSGPTPTPGTPTLTPTPSSTATPTSGPGGCGTANVAQGKAATTSSTENAGTPASAAVDGSATTRWSSAWSDPQWLQIDLGSVQPVCRVNLSWEYAFGSAYQIQVSNDGAAWTTLRSVTGGDGGTDDLTGLAGSGRYVRIYGTTRGTQYGYSLWEFQVYVGTSGPTATPPPTATSTPPPSATPTTCGTANAAQGKAATTSSTENAGTPASAAVDGNAGTRWSSAWSDPQWLQIDLGAPQTICRVNLSWEAAYGSAYQIQVSNDGAAWTTLRSVTGGDGGTDDLTGLSGSGRYVRIYGTTRATQWGYSLWEFQVFTR